MARPAGLAPRELLGPAECAIAHIFIKFFIKLELFLIDSRHGQNTVYAIGMASMTLMVLHETYCFFIYQS